MTYPAQVKNQARKLRKQGYSLNEIAARLGIAKSTASVWLRDVKLSPQAREKLLERSKDTVQKVKTPYEKPSPPPNFQPEKLKNSSLVHKDYSTHNLPIPQNILYFFYYHQKHSAQKISQQLKCSVSKVRYWMKKYDYPARSHSLATYHYNNPDGDPFCIKQNLNLKETQLKFLALGLYWGEGCKHNKGAVKLGNSDPGIIKIFQTYLIQICQVKQTKIKYHLQVFNDTEIKPALKFWTTSLNISPNKITPSSPIPSQGSGTYRRLNKLGVLTIAFFNIKLKKYLMSQLRKTGYNPQPKKKNPNIVK